MWASSSKDVEYGPHFVLHLIALIASIVVFSAVIFEWRKIHKTKSAGDNHLRPLLVVLTNTLFGILYGCPMFTRRAFLVTILSGVESIILILYIVSLIRFSDAPDQRRRCVIFLVFIFVVIAWITPLAYSLIEIEDFQRRHDTCGRLFMATNIFANFAVIPDMKQAWKTKSAEHLSVFWIFATLFNGIIGSVLALIPFDVHILVPNLFGIVSSVAQLLAYLVYRNSPPLKPSREHYDLERCRDSSSKPVLCFNPLPHQGKECCSLEVKKREHTRTFSAPPLRI